MSNPNLTEILIRKNGHKNAFSQQLKHRPPCTKQKKPFI